MSSSPTDPAAGAVEVTMPETGSDDGALLISWIKGPGSEVEPEEPICIVRVGDLTAEIVSPAAGVLGGIYAEPGQQVPPGASLAEIHPALESTDCRVDPNSSRQPDTRGEGEEEEAGAVEAVEAEVVLDPLANLASEIEALELDVPEIRLPREPATPAEAKPEPQEPERHEAEPVAAEEAEPEPPGPETPEPELPEPEPAAAASPPEPEPLPAPAPIELGAFRSPAVRRLAEEHEIDLEQIDGTGRAGRVTRADVLAAIASD